MTPHTGNQIIIIHIFPNILRSKSNHTMKFGQLIDTIGEIVFFKNHAGNTTGRLVPDLILFFLKKLYVRSQQAVSSLVSTYIGSPRFGHTIKTNCLKLQTVDSEICSKLIF